MLKWLKNLKISAWEYILIALFGITAFLGKWFFDNMVVPGLLYAIPDISRADLLSISLLLLFLLLISVSFFIALIIANLKLKNLAAQPLFTQKDIEEMKERAGIKRMLLEELQEKQKIYDAGFKDEKSLMDWLSSLSPLLKNYSDYYKTLIQNYGIINTNVSNETKETAMKNIITAVSMTIYDLKHELNIHT